MSLRRLQERLRSAVRNARTRGRSCRLAAGLLAAMTLPAGAQIELPQPIEVPRLPAELPGGLDRTVSGVTDRLDPRDLRHARQLRVRELLRRHRDLVEADPDGAPMLRKEVVAFAPSDAALDRARAAGFSVLRETRVESLGTRLVVLSAPPRMSTRRALAALRKLDPEGTYDFHHLYLEGGAAGTPAAGNSTPSPGEAATPDAPIASATGAVPGIGLIDGGVDPSHPALHGVELRSHGCNGQVVPSVHGTAVASLLAGRSDAFRGAAPGARLFAADVYCNRPIGGSVAAVAQAFDWLVRERVPVINVSLVGPRNVALAGVVAAVLARGHVIVAAVGNDGPGAAPLYPASYPGVIGVTAVDARERVIVEAGRGPQVDFAAPGADMIAAGPKQSWATVRGTSFAAPLVAGLLAARMQELDAEAAKRAEEAMAAEARDLGAPGIDVIYGRGLVGEGLRMDPGVMPAASAR